MFDGVRDRLISEEIRPYIFGGQPDITPADWNYIWFSKGAMTTNPPMYCCSIPLQTVVQKTNPALTFSLSLTGASPNAPIGTYYIKVSGISADGNTFTSIGTEQTIVNGLSTFAVNVHLPANAGFAKWRIFSNQGSGGPGSENIYTDVPGFATDVSFNTSHASYIPGPPASSPYFLGGVSTNLGQMNRLCCYDLVLKAWTIIDIPFSIAAFKQFRTIGSIPITVMTGFSDGGVRRWLGGTGLDTTWDAGAINAGAADNLVHIRVRSPEVFGKDASDRVYLRQLAIRGTGSPASLKGQVTINGLSGGTLAVTSINVIPMGNGEYAGYLDIGQTGVDAHVDLFGAGPMEIQSIDWLAIAKAIRGKVVV
jgi:hypothetical protein